MENIKEIWVKNVEKLTGTNQDSFREMLSKIDTLEKLQEKAMENKEYWRDEGKKWDHDFYYQMGRCVPEELLKIHG